VKYVIWKINVSASQVIQMMPVWFTDMHEARAAADALNEQYASSRTGFRYVVKEVHTEIIRVREGVDLGGMRVEPRPAASVDG
jgi:hypothetical protein